MISRRNIRVKVMQTLYTIGTLEKEAVSGEPQKVLQKHFDQTLSLFIYLIWFLTEVIRYAEKDAHQRAGKHLPNASDLNVNIKIAGNELLNKMLADPALKEQFAKEKPELFSDKELLRRIYNSYQIQQNTKPISHNQPEIKQKKKKIVEFILNDLLLANEVFVSHIEDNFSNWDDDGEMIVQLLGGYLQKPGSCNFKQMLSADKQLFARNLLQTVLEKSEHLQEIIVPKLKNWDPRRE
jgi:N utilization substance protein B